MKGFLRKALTVSLLGSFVTAAAVSASTSTANAMPHRAIKLYTTQGKIHPVGKDKKVRDRQCLTADGTAAGSTISVEACNSSPSSRHQWYTDAVNLSRNGSAPVVHVCLVHTRHCIGPINNITSTHYTAKLYDDSRPLPIHVKYALALAKNSSTGRQLIATATRNLRLGPEVPGFLGGRYDFRFFSGKKGGRDSNYSGFSFERAFHEVRPNPPTVITTAVRIPDRVVGSVAHGHVTIPAARDGDPLCITANTANAGALVKLNLCQAASAGTQNWSIAFFRPHTKSSSGFGLMCLSAHPALCLGVSAGVVKKNGRTFAVAGLYDHAHATPKQLVRNSVTLYRVSGDHGNGYKLGATVLSGFKLTSRDAGKDNAKFGEQLVWRKPSSKGDPTLFRFPRFSPAGKSAPAVTAATLTALHVPMVVGSVTHGHITIKAAKDGDLLCITANTSGAGATIHLNLCQAASAGFQNWSIAWFRQTRTSNTGSALICLAAHPHLCIGLGSYDKKDQLVHAVLYDHSRAKPADLVRDSITLTRNTNKSTQGTLGFSIGSVAFHGYKLTTVGHGRSAAKFGQQMLWRKIQKADPFVFTLPRLRPV